MVFQLILCGSNYMILLGDHAVYACGKCWMNLSMHLYIPFQKESLLIKEYILILSACPSRLCELTKQVRANDMGTMIASNDLSTSCITLNNMLSFLVNLFLTEGMCRVSCVHLQYASFCFRLLMSPISVSMTFMQSIYVVLGIVNRRICHQIVYLPIPIL